MTADTDDRHHLNQLVSRLRTTFNQRTTRPLSWRRDQLKQLKKLIENHRAAIFDALKNDVGKCSTESAITETIFVINEINYALKNLTKWAKPKRVYTPVSNLPGTSRIISQPLGVSLILAPWNYPFHLACSPLVAAIAAGCCAVVKPSELSPAVSSVLNETIPQHLSQDAFAVVQGDGDVAARLLEEKFDHLFFTGSKRVGEMVMTAAAKHLTPVTLELGGKSPAYIDATANLSVAARRIAWGKFLNAGQTCVAPDYLLVDRTIESKLLSLIKEQLKQFYGNDPKTSPDYGRIVNDRHFNRLVNLLDGGHVVIGGQFDASMRYIAPTI